MSGKAGDFDGCRRTCAASNAHTLVPGDCEKAVPGEAVVSLSVIVPGVDGMPVIAFDTYTTEQLADLIEPALRRVRITLGPNSLTALEHGHTLALTSGEIRALALEAAHALLDRNNP